MGRAALEVADIFRAHGPVWRLRERGHLSLGQLKVMSAIERCRSEPPALREIAPSHWVSCHLVTSPERAPLALNS